MREELPHSSRPTLAVARVTITVGTDGVDGVTIGGAPATVTDAEGQRGARADEGA